MIVVVLKSIAIETQWLPSMLAINVMMSLSPAANTVPMPQV